MGGMSRTGLFVLDGEEKGLKEELRAVNSSGALGMAAEFVVEVLQTWCGPV